MCTWTQFFLLTVLVSDMHFPSKVSTCECIHLNVFYTSHPVPGLGRLEPLLACTHYLRANIRTLFLKPLGDSDFPVHLTFPSTVVGNWSFKKLKALLPIKRLCKQAINVCAVFIILSLPCSKVKKPSFLIVLIIDHTVTAYGKVFFTSQVLVWKYQSPSITILGKLWLNLYKNILDSVTAIDPRLLPVLGNFEKNCLCLRIQNHFS